MATEIIDVVNRFVYEVTGTEKLASVEKQFQKNAAVIAKNTQSIERLQKQLASTTDQARITAITKAIENRTKAIKAEGEAIQKTIATDKQFQRALQQEVGIINEINNRLSALRDLRSRATSRSEIRGYTQEIERVEREQRRLTGQSFLSRAGGSILSGLGIGVGIGAIQQATTAITGFFGEASQLAAEVEGVERAFERLNRPTLLDELRTATRGTVSDLELMKQAVQFSNFGLPVDRLAKGLQFARIRAKETGQEVDYLVQSIVTGVGRQSPLILDNLGINAKRVSEEFQRTGNFAQAAFNIIDEEISKSGKDLETYAEKVGRINAEIQNQKAAFGENLNFLKEYWATLGLQIANEIGQIVGLGNAQKDYFLDFQKAQNEKQKAEIQGLRVSAQINNQYQANFEKFAKEFENADLASRDKIVQQAEEHYQKLTKATATWMRADNEQHAVYFESRQRAFQLFNQIIAKAQVNLGVTTPTNVIGLRQGQLNDVQEAISQRRGELSTKPEDAAEVARLNKIQEAVNKELDKINGTQKKAAKATKDAYDLARERQAVTAATTRLNDQALAELRAQLEAERRGYISFLQSGEAVVGSLEKIEATDRNFNDRVKEIGQLRQLRLATILQEDLQAQLRLAERFKKSAEAAKLREQIAQNVEEMTSISLSIAETRTEQVSGRRRREQDAALGLKQRIDAQMKEMQTAALQAQDRMNDALDRKRREDLAKEKAILDERKEAYADLYNSIMANASTAINIVLDSQLQALDREIEQRRANVEQARILAERGNAEVLEEEENALRRITREREVAAERQIQLNALLQASNMAVALSEAIGAVVKAAAQGDPYTIAARVLAAVAALVGGVAALSTAFRSINTSSRGLKDGEVDLKGPGTTTSDSIPARLSRGESVIHARATKAYKPMLQAMNDMRFDPANFTNTPVYMPKVPYDTPATAKQGADNSKLEKKLDKVIEVLGNMGVNVSQKVDRDGISQAVEAWQQKDRRRWR